VFIAWLRSPLAVAPDFVFSKLLSRFDFAIVAYLDDLLFISYMDHTRTQELISLLLQIFEAFGLQVHPTKSVTIPSLELDFLGFTI
jgi:hypothetical protein